MTRSRTRRRRATNEQRALAERWLIRTGRPVTPEAVDELAPHVRTTGRAELLELQAFARLVRLGQVPTAAAVRGEMVAIGQSHDRRARLAQTRHQVLTDLSVAGHAAADFVQDYRAQHDTGPTWNQLRQHTGWPRDLVDETVRRLRAAGWLDFDDQPGSLRSGRAFQPEPADPGELGQAGSVPRRDAPDRSQAVVAGDSAGRRADS